ncbi:MAG: HAMP domain-containing protein [Desulfuromonadales bacterium]|nr:HAMP domain-containing protein [Desulfuromonadales bacterium]
MRRGLSIRWKILTGLVVLAIFPMLLLSYLFSDFTDRQVSDQIELKADQAGHYIMLLATQNEKSLAEALKWISQETELVNALHFGEITGDPEQLHRLLKHYQDQYHFDEFEILLASGQRHILSANADNGEPIHLKTTDKQKIGFHKEPASQVIVEDHHLSIFSSAPIALQGSVIGNLRAFNYIDDQYAKQSEEIIEADIAFHNGEKVLSTNLEEFRKIPLNLDEILDEDAVLMTLRSQPHIVYNYPLNHDKAGFMIALNRSAIQAANSSLRQTLMMSTIGVMVAAVLLGMIISRGIAMPLNSMVTNLQEIAEGEADLTKTLDVSTQDEIGSLANSFNHFVKRLRSIIEKTRSTAGSLSEGTQTIRNRFGEMNNTANQQTKALEQAHQGVTEIGQSAGEVADNVSTLVASVQQSSAATHELESTTFVIAEQMENLFGIISDLSSSIHQLSSSNEQIDGNVIELSHNARETSLAAEELEQATNTIKESAEQTSQLAQQAANESLEGKAAVQDTILGISELQLMMEQAHLAIKDLGERSDAIGSIVNVIADVADQTNLLALNAAIIAAQAGEHGQGFAVVAEEIRDLAERTSVSTKEIAEIVENLQQGTQTAVATIEAGTVRAQQEVARSHTAGEALKKLHESSISSTEQITGIARQTQKQSEENRKITQAVLGFTSMLEQIASSIGQQSASTHNLASAAESMKNIAAKVKNSTLEQGRGSQQIAQSMEHIQQRIEVIDDATRAQRDRSNEIVESMAMVHRIAEENAGRTGDMDSVVKNLSEQAALLQKEIGAFKV